jgi:hypothetical protein
LVIIGDEDAFLHAIIGVLDDDNPQFIFADGVA